MTAADGDGDGDGAVSRAQPSPRRTGPRERRLRREGKREIGASAFADKHRPRRRNDQLRLARRHARTLATPRGANVTTRRDIVIGDRYRDPPCSRHGDPSFTPRVRLNFRGADHRSTRGGCDRRFDRDTNYLIRCRSYVM